MGIKELDIQELLDSIFNYNYDYIKDSYTMSKWIKTTSFGDYTQTPDRLNRKTNRNVHIIREARALRVVGKHAGSKPIDTLLRGIARAHKAMGK